MCFVTGSLLPLHKQNAFVSYSDGGTFLLFFSSKNINTRNWLLSLTKVEIFTKLYKEKLNT